MLVAETCGIGSCGGGLNRSGDLAAQSPGFKGRKSLSRQGVQGVARQFRRQISRVGFWMTAWRRSAIRHARLRNFVAHEQGPLGQHGRYRRIGLDWFAVRNRLCPRKPGRILSVGSFVPGPDGRVNPHDRSCGFRRCGFRRCGFRQCGFRQRRGFGWGVGRGDPQRQETENDDRIGWRRVGQIRQMQIRVGWKQDDPGHFGQGQGEGWRRGRGQRTGEVRRAHIQRKLDGSGKLAIGFGQHRRKDLTGHQGCGAHKIGTRNWRAMLGRRRIGGQGCCDHGFRLLPLYRHHSINWLPLVYPPSR